VDSDGRRAVGDGGRAVVLIGAYLAALVITSILATVCLARLFYFIFAMCSVSCLGNDRPRHPTSQPRP
jgi:hypothetical protein